MEVSNSACCCLPLMTVLQMFFGLCYMNKILENEDKERY